VAAIRDGTKTVEQVAQEKGEEYITGIILGNVGRYGVEVVKKGGKWVQNKLPSSATSSKPIDLAISNERDKALNDAFAKIDDKGGKHVPNAGAVGNMGEFLKQPGFGSELNNAIQKTSKIAPGDVSVYMANKKIGDHIKEGDQIYLDKLHKNHLEVFKANGEFRAVLNLDGSYNGLKSDAAKARRLPK
jgi:hypothetical protein